MGTAKHTRPKFAAALITAALLTLAGTTGAQAASAPVKEVVVGHIGSEVDKTSKGNLCTVESGDECQPAKIGGEAAAFEFSKGIAVAPNGDIYVAESGTHRLQELNAKGEFLLMIGKDVNKKGGETCTKAEESQCQAGAEGTVPGQFTSPQSVVVNPVSEDVYVAEEVSVGGGDARFSGDRVQELTPGGQFVLEIGKEVNETTNGNLCTQHEIEGGAKCKGPALRSDAEPYEWGNEQGAFDYPQGVGRLLAVDGSGLLYVGDQHRVQEFDAQTGAPAGEISIPETVYSIAADKAGDVYLIEGNNKLGSLKNVIRKFDPSGKEITSFSFPSDVFLESIALDPAGRLAILQEDSSRARGGLYEVGLTGLRLITEFVKSEGELDMAFSANGDAYGVDYKEVTIYKAVPVGELQTVAAGCTAAGEQATDVKFDCTLNGEVDAWGVQGTEAWFQWGLGSLLNERTRPSSQVKNEAGKLTGEEEALVPVGAPIAGLRPNESFSFELAGEDENVKSPELLTSTVQSFATPSVPPKLLGEPSVLFASSSAAVMFAELNPENARTEAFIEYGPGEALTQCPNGVRHEACEGVLSTATQESSVYGKIGTAIEAAGLQPATVYRYRLYAESENAAKTERHSAISRESSFTSEAEAVPRAATGAPSAVGPTSATVAGAIDPDGQPATYTFQLGVYNGASTVYGTVFSGPVAAETEFVEKSLRLTGLQPGTTYAYRIEIASGYGSALGEPALFTTLGLPVLLRTPGSLAQLPIPGVVFPAALFAVRTKSALPKKQAKKKTKRKRAKAHKSRLRAKQRHEGKGARSSGG